MMKKCDLFMVRTGLCSHCQSVIRCLTCSCHIFYFIDEYMNFKHVKQMRLLKQNMIYFISV